MNTFNDFTQEESWKAVQVCNIFRSVFSEEKEEMTHNICRGSTGSHINFYSTQRYSRKPSNWEWCNNMLIIEKIEKNAYNQSTNWFIFNTHIKNIG